MNDKTSSHESADTRLSGEDPPRVVREGRVSWLEHPPAGTGYVSVKSDALGALPVSLPDGDPVPGEATPGELLAISYGMFLASALSQELELLGRPAHEIVVEAACVFEGPLVDRELVGVDLEVWGRVEELDPSEFSEAVARARPRALRAAGARSDLAGELQSGLYGSIERR
jgi:hypothetical protein